MKKPEYYISIVILLLTAGLLFYIFFLLLYPFTPFVLNQQPVPILTKKISAGDDVVYSVNYCRYYEGSSQVSRSIVGPEIVVIPSVSSVLKKGCGIVTIHLPTSKSLIPGIYHILISADFHPNSVRTVTTNFESEDFEVIAASRSGTL